MVTGKGYGWKPSLPDARDYKLRFPREQTLDLPDEVDLRTTKLLPSIWDQGQLGSCVPHGIGAAYSYDLAKQGQGDDFNPSRLFIYFNGRTLENTVSYDSGLTITDGAKALNKWGAPPDEDWPYDISQFTTTPPAQAFADGLNRQSVKYARVSQTVSEMQACLAAGFPIVIGFTVYESFESNEVAQTGDVPMPGKNEGVLGGHCVVVVGYTTRAGQPVWICRNSWGEDWGDGGHFYFPQAYLLDSDLSDDFWVVQSVESPDPTPDPPSPGPVVVDVDQSFWDKISTWAFQRHVKCNKMAALASQEWARSKGFIQ